MDPLRRLDRKLRQGGAAALTDPEIRLVAAEVRRLVGADCAVTLEESGIQIEDTIRFTSLGARCREARETLGKTLPQLARQLKVPQYRLRAIENGRVREVEPEIAARYFEHLGITEWIARWARRNAELARRLSIAPTKAGRRR